MDIHCGQGSLNKNVVTLRYTNHSKSQKQEQA